MPGVDVAHLLFELGGTDLLVDVLLGAVPGDEAVLTTAAGAGLVVGVRVVRGREGRRRRELEVGAPRRRRVVPGLHHPLPLQHVGQ